MKSFEHKTHDTITIVNVKGPLTLNAGNGMSFRLVTLAAVEYAYPKFRWCLDVLIW